MFDSAYSFVKKEEGGYVNDPADSGGATMAGVTQATYDAFRKKKKLTLRPVRQSTLAERKEIFEGIWRDCRADRLPHGLSLLHFDFAVNAGNRRAAITLQRTVGVRDDGIIGPRTLQAVADTQDIEGAIIEYAELRRVFYRGLAHTRPKDLRFLRGWLLRTNRAERMALKEYNDGLRSPV
jgi:lysozyme family protein